MAPTRRRPGRIDLQKYRRYGVKKRPAGFFTKGARLMSFRALIALWFSGLGTGLVLAGVLWRYANR